MRNRNAEALRGLLGQGAKLNINQGLLNPDNIPQVSAPSLMDRLSSDGYQSFGSGGSPLASSMLGNLQNISIPQIGQAPVYPDMPDQVSTPLPSYGAEQLFDTGLGNVPSIPQMPSASNIPSASAVQNNVSPLGAPQTAQAPAKASPAGSSLSDIVSNPTFQEGVQAFAGMFGDIGAAPNVNIATSLQKHMDEAIKSRDALTKQRGMDKLRKAIAANPNMSADQIANLIAPLDPVKAAELKIATAKAAGMQSPYGKALTDLNRIIGTYGATSPQAAGALENLNNIARGHGMSLTVDPNTNAISFQQGSGLGGGGKLAVINGKLVSAPSRGAQTSQQQRQLATVARDIAMDAAQNPYIATGSNFRLADDRLNYSSATGEQKKAIGKRLVQAAVAAFAAKDAAAMALASQKIPVTNQSMKIMLDAIQMGWAGSTEIGVNNLPFELQQEARKQSAEVLKNISNAQDKMYASGFAIDVRKDPVSPSGRPYTDEQWQNAAKAANMSVKELKDVVRKKQQGAQSG